MPRAKKNHLEENGVVLSYQNGFTLVELLVVTAILGILSTIAIPNLLNAQIKAKLSRAVADIRVLARAEELYALDHNQAYPPPGGSLTQEHLTRLTSPLAYITTIPIDPFVPPEWRFSHTYMAEVAYREWRKSQAYVLWSAGPDKNYILAYRFCWKIRPCFGRQPVYTYNPTNGLSSYGDIYFYGGDPAEVPLTIDGVETIGRFPSPFGN